MKDKNLLTLVITLTVGIILSGSMLLPVVNDAADDMRGYAVYQNPDTIAPYTEINAGDHIHWTPTEITVNDVVIDGGRTEENWLKAETLLGASNQVFMCKSDNTTQSVTDLIYADITIHEDLTATVVIENTRTEGPTTFNIAAMGWGFVASNAGDWCQVRYDSTNRVVYFNNTDQIYTSGPAGGLIASKGTTAYFKGAAYENGITINGTSEVANGVYSMTFGLTSMDYSFEGAPVDDIRVIVVPAKVESTITPNAGANLIEVIPILVIVALLMTAVGAIAYRRAD